MYCVAISHFVQKLKNARAITWYQNFNFVKKCDIVLLCTQPSIGHQISTSRPVTRTCMVIAKDFVYTWWVLDDRDNGTDVAKRIATGPTLSIFREQNWILKKNFQSLEDVCYLVVTAKVIKLWLYNHLSYSSKLFCFLHALIIELCNVSRTIV